MATMPPTSTVFEMTMLDTTLHAGYDHRPGLDEIATSVYGKKYKGQQTGEMLSNDTWHVYDMTSEEKCLEWANLGDLGFHKSGDGGVTYHSVAGWLTRDTSADRYDFDDYRTGPVPDTMLATLILDGYLPCGRYLLEVCW